MTDGRMLTGSALEPVKGDLALTVLEGRLPRTPTQIALGSDTRGRARRGDLWHVDVVGADGGDPTSFTVVGLAVLPATDEYSVGVGVVLTPEGLAGSGQDVVPTAVLTHPPGTDVAAVEEELSEDYGLDSNLFTEPYAQGAIPSMAEPRHIAGALAAILVVLAVVGLAHAMLASTRRRRHDLGVLRAIGLRGHQAERAVLVEALALTGAGLVARRARIVAAADESRRRIERTLHDGAQQHLVALAVKVGLVRQLSESDPDTAQAMLGEFRDDVQAALEELREPAHGIYPPLRRDRGLTEALTGAANRVPRPTVAHLGDVGGHDTEVEAAIYFCCVEAIQNAGKHAVDVLRPWTAAGGACSRSDGQARRRRG